MACRRCISLTNCFGQNLFMFPENAEHGNRDYLGPERTSSQFKIFQQACFGRHIQLVCGPKPPIQQSIYSLFHFTVTVTIVVQIAPANDFSPVFKAAHYSFSVPERAGGKRSPFHDAEAQGSSYRIPDGRPMGR